MQLFSVGSLSNLISMNEEAALHYTGPEVFFPSSPEGLYGELKEERCEIKMLCEVKVTV